jgi:diguanylate cyclase (GGDEF)-like protein/PAS domain S-box-containing protein
MSAVTSKRTLNSALILGGILVVWLLLLGFGLGGETVTTVVSDFGLALAALAAGVACLVVARREERRERRFWIFLGLSGLAWGGGQLLWPWYDFVLHKDVPLPSVADVGYLSSLLFAIAALASVPTGLTTLSARLRTLIDGLMIAAGLLITSWVTILSPVYRANHDATAAAFVTLAYPIGDVIVITLALHVLLRARQAHRRAATPIRLLTLGLLAMAISDSGFAYTTATNSYAAGNVLDSGWFVGYLLVVLAAISHRRGDSLAPVEDGEATRPLGLLLPYAAVALAVGTTTLQHVRHGGSSSDFVFWARTFIITAMVARQVLTVRENLGLTKHLESRVAERTAELQASEQRFHALVQHSSDVVTVVDLDGTVLYQSDSIQRVFGYDPEALVGARIGTLLNDEHEVRLLETLWQMAGDPGRTRVLEIPVRRADGRMCEAEVTITNLRDNPHVGGLVLNTRDISERKMLEEQLVHDAFHDSLTSLANRALFKERVHTVLQRRGLRECAVLFLDLDGFKEVNDSLGHASGDLLLIAAAERLRVCARGEDTVARLGGDEFGLLVEDIAADRDPVKLAERISDAFDEPFSIDGKELHVRASIGIATNRDVDDVDQLLRNADLAMYRAKAARCGYECYDPEMHSDLVERLQMSADLREGLEREQFVLHYQPMLELSTGQITGVEALVRWQHPERGLVPPNDFIPLAEETGLIRPLGQWLLERACEQAVEWQRQGPLSLSVNISACQLRQPGFVEDVQRALEKTGIEPSSLTLEMTESVLLEHSVENLTTLERLKEAGVRLALDDFGTGYSSLGYLHQFPVDVLKIDRSFVMCLGERTSREAELVRTIVRLGEGLSLTTVAEGIEDHHQFMTLKRLGCELGQGFYFARPVPAEQIAPLLGTAVSPTDPAISAGMAAALLQS